MVRRRARDAGIETAIDNHSFRAIGITDYLERGEDINIAKRMAGHSNVKTTELTRVGKRDRNDWRDPPGKKSSSEPAPATVESVIPSAVKSTAAVVSTSRIENIVGRRVYHLQIVDFSTGARPTYNFSVLVAPDGTLTLR